MELQRVTRRAIALAILMAVALAGSEVQAQPGPPP